MTETNAESGELSINDFAVLHADLSSPESIGAYRRSPREGCGATRDERRTWSDFRWATAHSLHTNAQTDCTRSTTATGVPRT